MRFTSYLRVELGRLFRSPATWLVWILTALSPFAGLSLYRPIWSTGQEDYVTTTLGSYLANPALAAGLLSAILFAVLTVCELDRNHRSRTEALTDVIVSPLTLALVRLLALLAASVAALGITMLAWLPFTIHAAGTVFDGKTYVLCYVLFMFGGLPLSILFSAAVYQITRRFDLSLVLFAAFAVLSLTVWSQNWQLCWINPSVWAISDDFSNDRLFRSVAYVRLTWLAALCGLWAVSYLCVRRYEKGAFSSLTRNARRVYRPLIAIALLSCGGVAYAAQPFIDSSKELLDFESYYNFEYNEFVACSEMYTDVRPDVRTGSLYGTAAYQIQNTSGETQAVQFWTNPGYTFTSVRANGSDIPFTVNDDDDFNTKTVDVELPANEEIELVIEYGGFPREWNIISNMQGEPEISDIYMCLENDVLSPAPRDFFYRDGTLPHTMDITLPGQMTPVPFGNEAASLLWENDDGTKTWRVEASGYYMTLYAGDYVREEIEAAGMTVEFYYGRKHQEVMEAAGAKEAIRYVVEYCTERYGPLSFYGDGSFKLIQRRVSGGGYASYGASTMDELDFTAQNLNSAEKGSTAGEVVVHELVHQWWGLGNMFDTEDTNGLWSSEGLTVYTTYRIMKELYGETYAKANFVDQWQAQIDDYYKNFYVRNPEYLEVLPEGYRANIANSLSTVRRYCEMPLMLLKAEQLVGGEEPLDEILAGLFNRELDYTYPYLTYQEFLDACGLTEEDLRLD